MAMTSRDERRRDLGRTVSHLFAQGLFDELPDRVIDSLGRWIVVPVLGDDPIPLALRLLHQAGDAGNLIVLIESEKSERHLALVTAAVSVVEDPDAGFPVTEETTVAHVLSILRPGASMTLRFAQGEVSLDDVQEPVLPKAELAQLG